MTNQVLCTAPTQAAPTSWADQSLECTRPSCPWFPAALHPIVTPSSSSALSNIPQCLLPSWRHGLATTKPSRTVWRKATCQWHLPPANNHDHADVSARPRNDDECRTVSSECQKCANDADGPIADCSTHVDEPLCPQLAAQPAARMFLTSRGR